MASERDEAEVAFKHGQLMGRVQLAEDNAKMKVLECKIKGLNELAEIWQNFAAIYSICTAILSNSPPWRPRQ